MPSICAHLSACFPDEKTPTCCARTHQAQQAHTTYFCPAKAACQRAHRSQQFPAVPAHRASPMLLLPPHTSLPHSSHPASVAAAAHLCMASRTLSPACSVHRACVRAVLKRVSNTAHEQQCCSTALLYMARRTPAPVPSAASGSAACHAPTCSSFSPGPVRGPLLAESVLCCRAGWSNTLSCHGHGTGRRAHAPRVRGGHVGHARAGSACACMHAPARQPTSALC